MKFKDYFVWVLIYKRVYGSDKKGALRAPNSIPFGIELSLSGVGRLQHKGLLSQNYSVYGSLDNYIYYGRRIFGVYGFFSSWQTNANQTREW